MVVLGSFFFHPRRKSGCLISGCADGGLEVHSVPLLRQPQPVTLVLTYLPALPTAEVSSDERRRTNIDSDSDPAFDPGLVLDPQPESEIEAAMR
ncbi:hypothetical protein EVAR_100082_1 [Eumeta japonica]|uniref:Uncharacterized protein n=1 Tax=Eumeta variegata TaxID=151549 RepID=A0A4C1Z0T0_EUMVA|nr:hypothetical protein EVAR_100082_1 [Eumeta japonica]